MNQRDEKSDQSGNSTNNDTSGHGILGLKKKDSFIQLSMHGISFETRGVIQFINFIKVIYLV